jgi:nitric oxide reductase subunit B
MTHATQRGPEFRYFLAAGVSLLVAILAGAWAFRLFAWADPGDPLTAWTWLRPTHVTFAMAWIFLAAIGGIWAFLPPALKVRLYSQRLARLQWWLFVAAGIIALIGYLTGKVSGREYLNFPWPASLCIAAAWLCFIVNFFRSARASTRPWPVYVWMWATGIVAFSWTFIEGHLYLFPWFSDAPIRDLSVQWKSYGGLAGSWNMLVYGLSICLMERVGGHGVGRSRKAFAFYWLGLTNLMFGYAHHTYALPQSEWIRWMAFFISMTEWVVLASLIHDWAQPWNREFWRNRPEQRVPRAFLAATSAWIGINLLLAMLISIPTINWFTHGTYVVMAHAMGSTLGINSMILFGVGFTWILGRVAMPAKLKRPLWLGLILTNLSLLVLWSLLVTAGIVKGLGMARSDWSFHQARSAIAPLLSIAGWSALGLFAGMLLLLGCWFVLLQRAGRASLTMEEVSS